MHYLPHQAESRALVFVWPFAKIPLEIKEFVCVAGDQEVGSDSEIEVAVVYGSSLPVPEPHALSIEEDVLRLQVHVARHHVRIETRVNSTYSLIPMEYLLDFISGDETSPTKSPDEAFMPVSYTHLRAHETRHDLVCRLLL